MKLATRLREECNACNLKKLSLDHAISFLLAVSLNFCEFNRPHDRYERAPTRGRPSAGPWGNRWQTRRLNSLNRALNHFDSYTP